MEHKTLGQQIGIVKHTLSITNDNKEKCQLSINIDFRMTSDIDVKSWLCSNRVISGQRTWRSLPLAGLSVLDGQTFIANEIGRKVKSHAEKVAVYTNIGLPEDLAEMAVSNPVMFSESMKKVALGGVIKAQSEAEAAHD